ncbi:MAG: hypothetical protein WCH85_01945 [Methanomicrobiales archaeon]
MIAMKNFAWIAKTVSSRYLVDTFTGKSGGHLLKNGASHFPVFVVRQLGGSRRALWFKRMAHRILKPPQRRPVGCGSVHHDYRFQSILPLIMQSRQPVFVISLREIVQGTGWTLNRRKRNKI